MKINKLLLTLAMAGVTVSQLPTTAYAATDAKSQVVVEDEGEMSFTDVSPNHWAYRSIKKLYEEYSVLGGFPDGTFRGNRNLTRYEFAAAISKVMDKVEDLIAKGKPAGVTRADLDRLKKEFMTELEDAQTELKRLAKDQQDMQKDLDDTKDQVDMIRDMLPKVKITGEASFRHELVTPDFNAANFRVNAPQIGLKLGFMGENKGGFVFGSNITTSTASDVTNNFVSLGQLNSKFGINLDQLYVALRPWDGALDITAGRHVNPFTRATELIWDNDLTFDGSYLKLKFGDEFNYFSILGDYSLLRVNTDPANPRLGNQSPTTDANGTSNLYSGGVAAAFGGPDSVSVKLGVNYHQYTNTNNLIGKTLSLNPRTNLMTSDGKAYISDYQLVAGSAMVSLFPSAYLPVSIFADVSYNLGAGKNASATSSTDSALRTQAGQQALGLVGGITLGKLVESGNVLLGYKYKMVGTDSVFSAFNEDQLGGTNVMAHEIDLGVQLDNSTSLMITGQLANKLVVPSGSAQASAYTIRTGVNHKF